MTTAYEFRTWLRRAKPGTHIDYHSGELNYDRSKYTNHISSRDKQRIGRVADLAWKAYEMGLVRLVQIKTSPSVFTYRAIKRR